MPGYVDRMAPAGLLVSEGEALSLASGCIAATAHDDAFTAEVLAGTGLNSHDFGIRPPVGHTVSELAVHGSPTVDQALSRLEHFRGQRRR